MKKLPILLVALLLSLPSFALAQTSGTDFVPIAPIPGLTEGATASSQGLANFFNNLYIFLVGLAAALAVIMIIIGGVQYATTDNVSKKSDGRARIEQAILGLVLVLLPVLVFSIINPSILNLSMSWQPLKPVTSTKPLGGTGAGSTNTPTPSNVSGCTVVAGPPGAVFATCTAPTQSESKTRAQDWYDKECVSPEKGAVFFTTSCTKRQTVVNQTSTGGSATTQCVEYAATAYCSPTATANAVATREQVGVDPNTAFPVYEYLTYAYLTQTSFTNACTGKWHVTKTSKLEKTITCPPNNDPAFGPIRDALIKAGKQWRCQEEEIFCRYE